MIDSILVYPDEATALAAWPRPEDAQGSWIIYGPDRLDLLPVRIVKVEAVYDGETLVSPETLAPGYWLAVRGADLRDNPACVTVTDDELAAAGEPFLLYVNPAYTLHALAGRVDPTWCGSEYPFSRELTAADIVQP